MRKVAAEVKGAVLGYRDNVVLSGLHFSLKEGELVGLLGVSGAGKSTLLGALCGADVILQGSVEVKSEDPVLSTRGLSTNKVGLVPQLSDERWGPLCVSEVVSLGRPRHGLRTSSSERAMVLAQLDALGIAGLAGKRMHELSGGQRQRVSIARGLIASPKLLLCDEPTSGADPVLAAEIMGLLQGVAASGTAVVVATHDLGVVVPRLSRVLGLAGGRLALDIPITDLDSAALSLVYGPEVGS